MIHNVTQVFDQHLRVKFSSKPEVLKFLLKHERKQKVLENLCKEIEIIERRTFQISFNATKYRSTIESIAEFFAGQCLNYAHQQSLSESEKNRLRQKADQEKLADEALIDLEKEVTKEEKTFFVTK